MIVCASVCREGCGATPSRDDHVSFVYNTFTRARRRHSLALLYRRDSKNAAPLESRIRAEEAEHLPVHDALRDAPPDVFASISTAAKKPTIAQRALSSSTVRRYAVVTSSSWRGDSSWSVAERRARRRGGGGGGG